MRNVMDLSKTRTRTPNDVTCRSIWNSQGHNDLLQGGLWESGGHCGCLHMYMVDYPEVVKLSGVTYNSSPVTKATQKDLGNATPSEPRWWHDTKDTINNLVDEVDPDQDMLRYLQSTNKRSLSQVSDLFWG